MTQDNNEPKVPRKRANKRIPDPDVIAERAKPGKKSVSWREDPIILKRLSKVAELMLQDLSAWEIYTKLSSARSPYSLETAKRDVKRVRTLWRERAEMTIDGAREESLAQYRDVIKQARVDYASTKNPSYLRIVIDTRAKMDNLQNLNAPDWSASFTVNNIGDLTDDQLQEIIRSSTTPSGPGNSGEDEEEEDLGERE